jgi:hypothetical protein
MNGAMTAEHLRKENLAYGGTGEVSPGTVPPALFALEFSTFAHRRQRQRYIDIPYPVVPHRQ